jgi:hypothetical protein
MWECLHWMNDIVASSHIAVNPIAYRIPTVLYPDGKNTLEADCLEDVTDSQLCWFVFLVMGTCACDLGKS